MSVTGDILQSYRRPARVMRRLLSMGVREDRALAMLMVALGLMFLAEWPRLLRESSADPSVPFDARIGAALMGLVFVVPLLAYSLAAVTRLAAMIFGGGGTWYGARLALFWALLAVSPLVLLQGMLTGLIGTGPVVTATGVVVFAVFLWIWLGALRASEERAQ